MEFGNVYEVFQIGDIVKVKDIASIYCGEIGVIVRIEETGCYTEPIYTIRLDRADLQAFDNPNKRLEIRINAKSLVKAGHIDSDKETITMGVRNGKTYLTQIGKFKNKDNGFDSIIYQIEKKRKFAERGTDEMKKIEVKKIIFNNFKTIVFWNDGTKTIVSMSQEERNFDPEDAFRAAYTKKMYGTNSKIKRVIKEKSNIEQHQRIVEEKLKEELAKISQDYNKFMRELCPWLYKDEVNHEKQQDDERPIKSCQCGSRDDISKERTIEEPIRAKFKVGDGVTISSICSPYFGRGGTIVKVIQEDAGSIPQYTVEFYAPGNPGSSCTCDFPECRLEYAPTRAIDEKTKKMADAWYVFLHTAIGDMDDNKEKKDDEN